MQYQSESIDQLITALAKAQGEMSAASKDCKGYNYKYADLASVWGACREPLSRNGLAVTQVETQNDTGEVLVTVLGHSSGQWIRSTMAIRVKPSGKGNEIQERGSVLTYLRRYALSAIVGVAPAEDDDGSSGGNSYQANKASPPPPAAPKPLINEEQQKEIAKLLSQCKEEFQLNIWEQLKSRGVTDLKNMTINTYENLKYRLITELRTDEGDNASA